MNLFPWKKKEEFFTEEEKSQLLEAIKKAEQRTSGEVRIYIEPRCRFMDAVDRARELFLKLKMYETAERNATLVYVAVKDHQAAVFGDEGIHQKVGEEYWKSEVSKMLAQFRHENLAQGICQVVSDLGEALQHHFPYDRNTDKNELPDEIIFGR